MTTRRNFLATATLLAATMPLTSDLALATPAEAKPQLMFVQTAEDMKADDKTLRLVNVGKQTVFFSDRPERIAGHIAMPAYLEEWTAAAGKDNFSNDPPNATLSVYEPGGKENALAVVEISHPVVEGNDLVYHYKLIEGPMPKSGGAIALFIDWIGVGGGVGPGFHGVGRGGRGVGWR
jgi:hypothetical protein